MKELIFILSAIALTFFGCLKKEEYPNEPRIALESFVVVPDSAILTFTFTDGDGNFGLKETEYLDTLDCPKYFNLFCEYYEKENGQWVWTEQNPCTNPDSPTFYSRVPFAEPSGQFKAQKGEVRLVMDEYYLDDSDYDTCKFEIYVVDYTQNRSNVVITQEFVKPQ